MKKFHGTELLPNDQVVHVHISAFVRKVDVLGSENVADFLTDPVTKIWLLKQSHRRTLAKSAVNRFLTY